MAAPAAAAASPVTPEQATALGRQAYLYGLPLLEFERVRENATSVRCPNTKGDAPVNSFSTATTYATPRRRTVVAPNVDTLYSIAHLDLGRGPVVLEHPDMGDRYFVFQFLDPYTNVLGYVGSRTTGRRAGRFAITWSGASKRVTGTRVVRSSSRRVWVIGRTLAGTRADQRLALQKMRRYTLTPPGGARRFPAGCKPGAPSKKTTPQGAAFLDALGRAMRDNPPPARDRPLLDQLATVGVGPGLRPADASLSAPASAALTASVTAAAAALPAEARATVISQALANNGWSTPAANIGDYGIDYPFRAAVAELGLGANTPAEAVYPTALTDGAGAPLNGKANHRLVFPAGKAPPVRAFWSLTLYDGDGFLVPNAAQRYAVGPSHPPFVTRTDGSIVIAVQRTRPTDPEVNWLPAPAAPFRLSLRLYWPKPAVLNGTWKPPAVTRAG